MWPVEEKGTELPANQGRAMEDGIGALTLDPGTDCTYTVVDPPVNWMDATFVTVENCRRAARIHSHEAQR
jgi:hypothetical protein